MPDSLLCPSVTVPVQLQVGAEGRPQKPVIIVSIVAYGEAFLPVALFSQVICWPCNLIAPWQLYTRHVCTGCAVCVCVLGVLCVWLWQQLLTRLRWDMARVCQQANYAQGPQTVRAQVVALEFSFPILCSPCSPEQVPVISESLTPAGRFLRVQQLWKVALNCVQNCSRGGVAKSGITWQWNSLNWR